MSVAPPLAPPPSAKDDRNRNINSVDAVIEDRIAEACKALWWGELIRHSLKLVLGVVVAVGIWILLDHWVLARPSMSGISNGARIAALAALVVASAAHLFFRIVPLIGHSISPEYAARSLERNYPSLRQALTSYVTLKDDRGQAGLSGRVVASIGASTAGYLKQHEELPAEATGNMKLWVATLAALAGLVFYAAASPKNSLQSVRRLITPTASIAPATRVSINDVTPGDAEAIAGRTVQVAAEIRGLREDELAVCEIQYTGGAKQVTLRPNESSRFEAGIPLDHTAAGVLPYRIIAGDAISPTYQFRVKDVPVVALKSVTYQPPAYTRIESFTRTSGAISAIDGSVITLTATTNRAIARAAIEFNPKPVAAIVQATDGAVEMNVGEDGTSLSVTFPLKIDVRRSASVRRDSYRIRVWDESGASNPEPIIYPIEIIADLPPEVAIMLPTRVPKDVPIGTQQIVEVHASDADFGLSEIRLQIKSGIRTIGEPVLWRDNDGRRGNQVAEYRFRPTELGLTAGDSVRIIAIATDNKADPTSADVSANQSVTDPIELRIVPAEQMPPNDDAAGEGLSASDDKPAADPDSANQDSSEGSSNDSGEGEQQQGGGGAEGEQGSQQSGESGQQGSGGGKGDSSEKSEGENQGSGGQPSGDNPSEGEQQGDQANPGDQASSGEQGKGEQSQGQPGEGESSQGEPGAEQADEAQPGEGEPSQSEQAGDAADSTSQSNSQGTGENQGQRDSTKDRSSSGDAQRGEAGESSGDPSDEGGDQTAPQHDGEAFERIQDFLNEQKQKQGGQSQSGDPSQNQPGGQSPEQSAGDRSQDDAQDSSQRSQPQGSQDSQRNEGKQGESGESPSGQSESSNQANPDSAGTKSDRQSGQGEAEGGESAAEAGKSPEQGSGQQASEQPGGKEQGDAAENAAGDQSGDSGQSQSEQGQSEESQSDQGQSSQSQSGDQQGKSSEGQPGAESQPGDSDQTGTPADQPSDAENRSPQSSSQGRPGSGDGTGEGDGSESAPSTPQTEAANDDYARKATDMVLDYLDQTRDAPDPELLERLNWTEQDLKRFQDRWQEIRDLENIKQSGDAARNRAAEEALRSLGLRPPSTGQNRRIRDSADSLDGIRDSGNRRRPPAAFRDAFDAFRRQMGSGQK